jgi:hypothetical protein
VIHAWALPRAGAYALADDTMSTSPEEIARRAGWQELPFTNARLDVPNDWVRSARGAVRIENDAPSDDDDHPVVTAVMSTVVELALSPLSHK